MRGSGGFSRKAWITRSSAWIGMIFVQIFLLSPWTVSAVESGNHQLIPFFFTAEPSDLTVSKDQPAVIDCAVSGVFSTVKWKRDDIPVVFDARRSLLPNGSLSFTKVLHNRSDRPDEGVYQCVVSNQIGTIISRPAKLQIASLPAFDDEPRDQRRIEGQTARFECSLPASPVASVSWYKDDRPLILSSRMFVLPSGALEIGAIQPSDSGNYKCKVENSEGKKFSATGRLIIDQDPDPDADQLAPVFSTRTKTVAVSRGDKAVLECAAHGFPIPTISWLKNGLPVDLKASRFSLIGMGNLQIDNAQPDDAGLYKCHAENSVDSENFDVTLDVHETPTFVKKPKSAYGYKDSDVVLECEIRGTPQPTIQWYKNGDLIIANDYFRIDNEGSLKISGLLQSDSGYYQCFGSNSAGVTQATAQLIVLDTDARVPGSVSAASSDQQSASIGGATGNANVPSAPRSLQANSVNARSVTLTWLSPASTNSPVLTYSVYYKESGSVRERVLNATGSLHEAVVRSLRPDTSYVFRVVAYNGHGPGESSPEVTARTRSEADPVGSTVDLRLFPLSATEVKVEWDAPQSASGIKPKFRLVYREKSSNQKREIETEKHQFVLTGLKPYTEYATTLVAIESGNAVSKTPERLIRTLSDVPSASPENVVVEPSSANSLTVRWEPPAESTWNGPITEYKIRYRSKNTRKAHVISVSGDDRSHTIQNLERGHSYLVRVAAGTVNGTGPPSDWIGGETFADDLDESRVPGQPASLRVKPTAKNIVINWAPPNDGNVVVRGYTIGWGVGIPDVYTKIVDSKDRFFTIDELEPGSEYVISLRAFNNMGDGRPAYETVTTRMATATPDSQNDLLPPVGLQAIVISDSTIVLKWTDTSLPNGELPTDNRLYTVRYSRVHGDQRPKTVDSTDLEVPVDGLRANTLYMFEVKISKGRTQSTWSLSVMNRTFEAAPSSAPLDLTVMPIANNPTAVMINYSPPEHPNGLITGYVVFFTSDNSQHDRDWAVEGVVGDKLTTIIRGLQPDTRYFFKIQARNSKGYGPLSPVVVFQTPQGDPGRTYSDEQQGAAAPGTLYIIVACASSAVIVAIILLLFFCCRRSRCVKKGNAGYKAGKKGKHGNLQPDLKPPDLWIHHQDNMELKNSVEKSPHEIIPILKHSNEYTNNINLSATLDRLQKRTNSFVDIKNNIDGRGYNDFNKFNSLSRRNHRPLMVATDQRDAAGNGVPMPNIHNNRVPDLMQKNLFPRQQQQHPVSGRLPAIESSPQHSIGSPDAASTPSTTAGYDTASSGAHILSGTDTIRSTSQRNAHPLKSFSVPAPPPQVAPAVATTPRNTSTLRASPASSSPYKRSPMTVPLSSQTARSPKPPVTFVLPSEETQKLPHHYSSEELSAEMANLEGLIKDLNVLHATEFSC